MSEQRERRVTDEYGTIERHVGECRDCGKTVQRDGTSRGFEGARDKLSRHIDDGSACEEYHVTAHYEDGGERRVE